MDRIVHYKDNIDTHNAYRPNNGSFKKLIILLKKLELKEATIVSTSGSYTIPVNGKYNVSFTGNLCVNGRIVTSIPTGVKLQWLFSFNAGDTLTAADIHSVHRWSN